jgi:hypothetical protein
LTFYENPLIYLAKINQGVMMKIPCVKRLSFLVIGLSFLQPALSAIQFNNLTLIATALVLGGKFSLTQINLMWLKEKSISTLSWFMSDAKLLTPAMMHLYALQAIKTYKITGGYFLIDDTLQHHTKFCKLIHGVFVLFDHAAGTNLKSKCIVFLYYSDGGMIKFPIAFRIFYKENGKRKWESYKKFEYKPKYTLALELLEWALKEGYPPCVVLADSWFGIEPFIEGLRKLKLKFILEVRSSNMVRVSCKEAKLTPTGRLAKHQYDLISLPEFFKTVSEIVQCGFEETKKGKQKKVLYNCKVETVRLNAVSGKHRVVESMDVESGTFKYFISDQLTWEAVKMIKSYSFRWVIEEFFRNAKQLSDMEGATIRSEQGVTLALCLVSWIDFLLHLENYKQSTAGKLPQDSLTIPSIVRRAKFENLTAFIKKVVKDRKFVEKWLKVEGERIYRKRKEQYDLIELGTVTDAEDALLAA